MTLFWNSGAAALHLGDALDVLAQMPDGSADCIVTSPPYWAKRDYGVAGQYGHEPSPAAYIAALTAVFREARRVLAGDGTCWLNLGDSYSAGGATPSGMHAYLGSGLRGRQAPGMAAKNLLGLPWRVALALQDDGWILRNAIVWHKPNAMPESVRDRLGCRYELIFLLVKQASYWFDLDPIRIPPPTVGPAPGTGNTNGTGDSNGNGNGNGNRNAGGHGYCRAAPTRPGGNGGGNRPGNRYPGNRHPGGNNPGGMSGRRPPKYGPHARQVVAGRRYGNGRRRAHPKGRNPGDVWSIPTRPYHGPHFAAFPIDIPLQCIAAGCRPGGNVLDPFSGTGTTGIAALRLGRRFTGIELNPAFAALAAARLAAAAPKERPEAGEAGR